MSKVAAPGFEVPPLSRVSHWRVTVLSIFPEMFPGPLGHSLAGKALVSMSRAAGSRVTGSRRSGGSRVAGSLRTSVLLVQLDDFVSGTALTVVAVADVAVVLAAVCDEPVPPPPNNPPNSDHPLPPPCWPDWPVPVSALVLVLENQLAPEAPLADFSLV